MSWLSGIETMAREGILRRILAFLPRRNLVNVSITCWKCYSDTVPLLYETITSTLSQQGLRQLEALTKKKDHVQYVRVLELRANSASGEDDLLAEEEYRILRMAIMSFSCLQYVRIFLAYDEKILGPSPHGLAASDRTVLYDKRPPSVVQGREHIISTMLLTRCPAVGFSFEHSYQLDLNPVPLGYSMKHGISSLGFIDDRQKSDWTQVFALDVEISSRDDYDGIIPGLGLLCMDMGKSLEYCHACHGFIVWKSLRKAKIVVFAKYALQVASAYGNEQVVKLLLDKGVDVNVQDGEYGRALYAASSEGNEQIVKLLLERGADINAQGGEALYAASSKGHEQIVKLLLNKGADANAQGGKALYVALKKRFRADYEVAA